MARITGLAAATAVLLAFGLARPASAAQAGCSPSGGLQSICGAVASEDLVQVPGTRWLIASGLNVGAPAHLYLVDTRAKTVAVAFPKGRPAMQAAAGCPGPPDLGKMSTDGLGLRPGKDGRHMLYAANHGDRTAIEMFEVDARGPSPALRWVGCAPLPPRTMPNAASPLPGGRLLVSSFYDPTDKDPWGRMARGENTGRLLEWRPGQGFRDLPGGVMSGANGLEVSADGKTIYASAWSGRKLVVLAGGARREIALDFMPDNIHRLGDGSLLVAGQRTEVAKVAACTGPQCPQAWVVARVNPRTGAVREVLARDGTAEVNYACTALEVDGVVYITARGDGRILYAPLK